MSKNTVNTSRSSRDEPAPRKGAGSGGIQTYLGTRQAGSKADSLPPSWRDATPGQHKRSKCRRQHGAPKARGRFRGMIITHSNSWQEPCPELGDATILLAPGTDAPTRAGRTR